MWTVSVRALHLWQRQEMWLESLQTVDRGSILVCCGIGIIDLVFPWMAWEARAVLARAFFYCLQCRFGLGDADSGIESLANRLERA